MLSFRIFVKKKTYFASAFFYSCLSLCISTWVTYIPYIADRLHITEGKIGGALFFSALGSFTMIPFCNKLVARFGIGRMTFYSLLGMCVAIYAPFLAPNYHFLCAALFLLGIGTGSFAVTINSLTATIEKSDGVFIMSGSHGFFSFGGMLGAVLGSLLSARLGMPILHLSILVAMMVTVQIILRPSYFSIKGSVEEKTSNVGHSWKPLAIISLIGLIVMVSEGAVADWSALYLKNVSKLKLEWIGLGYAGFSMLMAAGRFVGDWVSHRFGSWQIISFGLLLGLLGFGLVILPLRYFNLFGFSIIGLGFSVIVPEIYRLASRTEGIETTAGVSFIAGAANVGFLLGPVIIGFIAELYTLRFSFIMLMGLVFAAFSIALFQRRKAIKG